MKLNDLAGSLEVDHSQAVQLIRAWFDPEDIIVISGKEVVKTQAKPRVLSQSHVAKEFVSEIDDQFLSEISLKPAPMDIYINVGAPREHLTHPSQRVKEADLEKVIGIIGDFDVKENSFEDTAQIIEYLDGLSIPPTIIVESGSGGIHAWWKFAPSSLTGKVNVTFGKEIAVRWWSYLNLEAQTKYGASVDKLVDTARMLRLPGTIHWPRKGEGSASSVTLRKSDGPSADPLTFINASQDAWKVRLTRVAKTKETDKSMSVNTKKFADMLTGNLWTQRMAVAGVEDYFMEKVPWTSVLEPAGWSFTRTDSQGREEWARPGREGEKSACVGWADSPHVMSLLSTSHDTGLLDLLDADIPLTKWRVSLRLNFNDDYQAMVKWTMELMKSAG